MGFRERFQLQTWGLQADEDLGIPYVRPDGIDVTGEGLGDGPEALFGRFPFVETYAVGS
jgi:hypothetical protein